MRKLRASIIGICFLSPTAYAVGGDNTHTQGVRLAGRGFDESVAKQIPKPVPSFELKDWPPPVSPRSYLTTIANDRKLEVTASCPTPHRTTPIDSRFALCSGQVRVLDSRDKIVTGTPACDLADSSGGGDVPLLAIRANWNMQGRLELVDDAVTFACAPTFPPSASIKTLSDLRERTQLLAGTVKATRGFPRDRAKVPLSPWKTSVSKTVDNRAVIVGATLVTPMTIIDLSNLDTSPNLGVLAKCYFWGFAKDSDVQRLRTYEACVRAARADYCGNGKSQTEVGTLIQIYDAPTSPLVPPPPITQDPANCKPFSGWDPCFEALWDEQRALCISHARWEEMPPDDCQKTTFFPVELQIDGEGKVVAANGETTVHCASKEYDRLVGASRIKNRSGLNSRKGVSSCMNDVLCP